MCKKCFTLIFVVLLLGLAAGISNAERYIPPGFPDANNTGIAGVGLTEGDLDDYTGPMTITTNGTVIEQKHIDGELLIQADNVTIRKCLITGGNWYQVRAYFGNTGFLLEDCTLIGVEGFGDTNKGIHGSDFIMRRCNSSNYVDDVSLGANCLLEDCFIHSPASFPGAHIDTLELYSGNNTTIRHNTFLMTWQEATGAVNVTTDFGNIHNLTIEDNFMSGGGYTLYLYERNNYTIEATVKDNIVEKDSWQYGHLAAVGPPTATYTCNIFHDGTPWPENPACGGDTTAPSPDPMTWATVPYATGSTSISMTATTATDASGVEYYFDCTAGGGNDSGWQSGTTYVDTGLSPSTQYTYRVKARDLSTNYNETSYSGSESATTDAGPPSNVYCISPDGSSGNSGLDWNNAWRQLPSSLTRGNTYYFADGSYDSYTFDDAPSATYITIKKATAADHGTATGWQSSYGDGVASFSNCSFSNTSYIILDGQVEDGFTLIKEGLGGTVINITGSNHITLRNCDLDGNFATLSGGEPTSHTNGACNILHADSSSYLTIENCKLHNVADDGLEIHGSNYLTITGNEIYNLYGCGTDGGCGDCYNGHSDGIEIFDVENAEFKENLVYDARSTSAFICDNWTTDPGNDSANVTLVNNIFYNPETGFCIYLDSMHGVDATHNVFWGIQDGSYGGLSISNVTDLDMYNNIILSINYSHMGDTYNASEHRGDYNLFGYDTGQYPLQTNDIIDSDPDFENIPGISGPADRDVVAEDFRLTSASSAIDAGTNMGITTDFFGNTRPQGSGYDMGVHEYGAAPDTTAPSPDPMTWATEPYATGASSISMTATTATDASGVEYYFECTAGGGHSSSWQDSTTYEDTGLSASTQYTYRVKARDKSSNQNETGYSTTKSATTDSAGGAYIDATFDSDADGFTYADITNGSYVDGSWNASYGYSGGGIRVRTGPGPTGGATDGQYSDGFNLSSAGWVTITLRYRLEMGEGFESNEYGEAYLMIDSTRYGNGTGDSLVRIVGNGNGGGTDDSGWLSGEFDVDLSSGSHTIKVGAYNNNSTAGDEWVNAYFDNVKVEDTNAPGDTTPPSPDPMTWSTEPYATGTTSISMTATTATDTSGVEYYFECTAGGGHSSSWQDSTTYEDTGLSPSTQYTYQVKARDKSSNQNETGYSTTKSATTDAPPDTTAPSPDPMTWATEPYATGVSSISMTATTATDVSGVEYYFECTAGGGHSSSWQDSTTYEDTGLDDLTEYTYRVKARDKSSNLNETGYSTTKSATTQDGTAPSPDPMTWATVPYATGTSSISMTATTATDASGVEYYFDCTTTGGHDSGWQASATYEDTGLDDLTQYTYRVKARDGSSNLNETAYSTSQSATTQDGTAPGPDPMTWATNPYATGTSSISMTATTATDASGVEYYFDCTAGGGHDSSWQDSATYEDTGLSASTQYTYQVKARDKSTNLNETGYSTTASATTDSGMPGPVSWWKLDESSGTNADDSSGNNHDGTLSGGSWAPTSGKFDGAVDLGAATSDHVEVPTTGMSASAGTVSLWGRIEGTQTGSRYFFGHTSAPGTWSDRIQFQMDGGDNYLDLGLGDQHNRDVDIMALSADTWYHIALTWDNGDYVVYVDGIEKASGTYTGLSTLNSIADIGNNGNSSDRTEAFQGLLDEVRIYDEALSKYDIADMAGITIASAPSPADEATGVSTTADLSWSAGYYAASTNGHDVYMGTDYNSVADANHSSSEFKGNQSSTTYDPGTMSTDTTYYWAIDEVNDINTWTGSVFSFTTILPDTTAPSPDPMTWATVPYATGSSSISMTATTATDASGVEYYFDCTAGGGNDSGWQDSTTYEDTGLSASTQYTYQVKARDKSANQNETGWSTTASATTDSDMPDTVSWWKLDESSGTIAADSSGNGYDGTRVGASWAPTGGHIDGAADFGTDNTHYIEVPATGLSASAGTVALWIRLEGSQPADRFMFGHTATTYPWTNRIQLTMRNGTNQLCLGLGDQSIRENNIYNFSVDTWYHVALTWDGSNYLVYVDGAEEASGTYTGFTTIGSVADIGNTGNSTYRVEGFQGKIDDVRIYNQVLSQSEIQTLAGE